MPTVANCPICDRPAGDPYYKDGPDRPTVCGWFLFRRDGYAVMHDKEECQRHAFNWREAYFKLLDEATKRLEQLRVAQKALARHHEAQAKALEPFRDNARIE